MIQLPVAQPERPLAAAHRPEALSLLGVDVGFSETGRTTGMAWCGPAGFGVEAVTSRADDRLAVLPAGVSFDIAAIDRPLTAPGHGRRGCELLFIRGLFATRCKPGLSDVAGTGRALRQAAHQVVEHLSERLARDGVVASQHRIIPDLPVVEAFPNLFLGVLIDESEFDGAQKRGKKFDLLYERARQGGRLQAVLDCLEWRNDDLEHALADDSYGPAVLHERRAALVCLLTAACAAAGRASRVGDPAGGWLWLPPKALWRGWPLTGLDVCGRHVGVSYPDLTY